MITEEQKEQVYQATLRLTKAVEEMAAASLTLEELSDNMTKAENEEMRKFVLSDSRIQELQDRITKCEL